MLAHSLAGLAIRLQGARKLAGREQVSDGLRTAIERSAELAKAGLADARQAVGALRGDPLPAVDQLSALVEGFRRDTGAEATVRIDATPRPLPAEASLALFRGAQEALTNIARYAPGAATAVTVSYQPGRTLVTVEDHARPCAARPGPAAEPGSALLADAGGGHGLTRCASAPGGAAEPADAGGRRHRRDRGPAGAAAGRPGAGADHLRRSGRDHARALQAGARGYLTKDASAEQIETAIRAVHAGQTHLDPAVQERLVAAVISHPPPADPADPGRKPPDGLTAREAAAALPAGQVGRRHPDVVEEQSGRAVQADFV